jgi:hypothetical protein
MSDGTITRDDLREAMRDIKVDMNRGFDGVHERLDNLNSKTATLASAIAVHEERWMRLDKATSVHPVVAKITGEDAGVKGDWKTLSLIGSLAAGAVSGLVWGLFKVVQFIQSVAR